MRKELDTALALVDEAGRAVLDIYGREFAVGQKSGEGPVTLADLAADRIIREGLSKAFPDDAVLSEEGPDPPGRAGRSRLWLVDPLDGTRQFVDRIDEFAVMVGLAIDGVPRLGVVGLPAEGLTFAGAEGLGVVRIGPDGSSRAASIEPWREDGAPVSCAISRSHARSRTRRAVEALGRARVVSSGSVGRKAMLVLDGRADCYLTLGTRTRHWDSCAPEALVRIAGGSFTDALGGAIRYGTEATRNARGLAVCRAGLGPRLVEAVRAAERGDVDDE